LHPLALGRLTGAVEGGLGDLEVPVAEVVPQELGGPAGRVVLPVAAEPLTNAGDRRLQPALDPAARQSSRGAVALRVVSVEIGQHQARGVPELVVRVSVAL